MNKSPNFSSANNQNRNKLALTIDIEDWYHIPSVTGSPFSIYRNVNEFFKNWNKRYDYLSEPTTSVLNLLDDFEIKATFFIVADIVDYYPGLVEMIAEKGHEIACHGLHHTCNIDPDTKKPLFTVDQFEKNMIQAKKKLENVYGKKVIGYRAPNGLFGEWMFDSLIKLEFKYDSSISLNSLYKKADFSLDSFSSSPSIIKKKNGVIYEFPFAFWDIWGFKLPTSGGPMLRFLGSQIIMKGLNQSLKRGHSVFYFHPIDISNEVFPDIGKGRPFYWVIKGEKVKRRIKNILSNYKRKEIKFTSLFELYNDLNAIK